MTPYRKKLSSAHFNKMLKTALCFTPLFFASTPSYAGEVVSYDELKKIQATLESEKKQLSTLDEKSQNIEKELSSFRQRLIMLNEKIRSNERDLLSLKSERTKLEDQKQKLLDSFSNNEEDQKQLIMALEKIALHPPVLQLLNPSNNKSKIETTIILNTLLPQLREKSAHLQEQIQELSHIENQLGMEHHLENKTKETIRKQYAELSKMLEQRAHLFEETNTESIAHKNKIQELSSKANSLQELIASLEASQKNRAPKAKNNTTTKPQKLTPQKQETAQNQKTQRNQTAFNLNLTLPVQGKIINQFGEKLDEGLPLQGIRLETNKGSPVIAPYKGEVLFVGPFRNYGNILIIKHDDELHSLIAGLDKINTVVGHKVITGEPLGTISNDNAIKPIVYYELRDHGTPINPIKGLQKIRHQN
ncbi:MAG: peptidoglycan DD-metalloendopeptidase family protein [Alphaproteobacteria bacterium]|nr:peptidoglycan DD-metalloendopeptidase family protein [Alphaproteobacteria bacterium]MBP9877340.1 peptidoglycan DD-metalloendopeptidase family protein [Alphaproteobacteria bacterium]